MARIKVWKDALYLGDWVTPSGQRFSVDDDDLRYFNGRTKDMLAKRVPLPWGTEHDDVQAVTKLSASERIARWAERTKGHLHGSRIVRLPVFDPTIGKETLQNVMQLEMDVDERDRDFLENVKNVSPEIYPNFRDRNGPASDDIGPFWPGQSIAWLAVTPKPVQYPQRPFDFTQAAPVRLSAATVCVSLSSATFQPIRLSAMPKPPFGKDDDKEPKDAPGGDPGLDAPGGDAGLDAPGGDAPAGGGEAGGGAGTDPSMADSPGEDLEPGGPPLPPMDMGGSGAGDPAQDAARIHRLAGTMKELGMIVTPTPGMDLGTFVDHCCTAVDTHKATKALGDADDAAADQTDPNANPDPNQRPPVEPETSQTQPIMMSATELTELAVLRKDKVTSADKALKQRIATLHARGIIDNGIRDGLLAEIRTVPIALSSARPGQLATNPVEIQVRAYEKIMATGKAGSFAPHSARPAPGNKPISAAALSASQREEVEDPPYQPADGDGSVRPLNNAIISKMTGTNYTGRNGTATK